MNMGKELSNGKIDKEAIKHAIKTKYLNSYKVIVAGGRDFDNYEFLKKSLMRLSILWETWTLTQ